MQFQHMPKTDLEVSRIALGCMRIAEKSVDELEVLIKEALDLGINFFDHADIYGGGRSEELFGQVLARNPGLRDKMVIQSKADIVFPQLGGPRYDCSRAYLTAQVEAILDRLQTDHLDLFLLHRADPLCDPAEVAETFDDLKQRGLVRYFGVSNHTTSRMDLLSAYVREPLVANQMQLSIVHAPMIDAGMFVNMTDDRGVDRDGGMLDYCKLHGITLQTWCSLQASWEDGSFIDNPKYDKVNEVLARLADKYGVSKSAVAIAWLLRLPAQVQAIVGTTSPVHLRELAAACDFDLTRQEWYDLYLAGDRPLP